MQSMAYLAVAHTATSSPAPEQGGGTPSIDLSHLLTGGGGLLVLAVVLLMVKGAGKAGGAATGKAADKAVASFFASLARALASLLRYAWRFLAGRELWGKPKSDAKWLRMGTAEPVKTDLPALTQLASTAIPAPVSLVKKPRRKPRPWAVRLGRGLAGYNGPGRFLLDMAGAVLFWIARAIGRTYRGGGVVVRVAWPVVAAIWHALAVWNRWPYAARSAARTGSLALALALYVPAWRGWGLLALLALFVAFAAAAVTGPAGTGQWGVPPVLSDEERYGPALWTLLRDDLSLPADTPREEWLHMPALLSDPAARIVVRLPWTFRGSEGERMDLTALLTSRIPGDWVPRWDFRSEHHTAVYTHRPPAKPKPECPDMVDFFAEDIQRAIAACKVGEIVLGKDENAQIVIRRLDGETPHWALSVGTGGGKSTFNVSVAVQLVAQGYILIVADVKRSSVKPLEGIPGVHIYNDPQNPQDMRAAIEWFKDEIDARSYVKDKEPGREFPGLLLLIEEANEFADVSREWWDENRKHKADEFGPAERAADTIWADVASAARLGRFVRGNILAVFQDLRDQALGGKGLRNLFRLKFMGNFTVNQWKNVIGTTPVPDSVDKAGRMMIVEGNSNLWVQTLYGDSDALTAWALEHRRAQNFDPAAGLFGAPPERSGERLPHLLRGLSRDAGPEAPQWPSEGGLSDETAGGGVTLEGSVTPGVTPGRDRLRLVPAQGGQEAQGGPQADPTAPPELLPLAEVARRLEDEPGVPAATTMRKHKERRDEFPRPTLINGKELFTESQIRAYYKSKAQEA